MLIERPFYKMHGCGNDFILTHKHHFDDLPLEHTAIKLCDRHFGIGADGLIVAETSDSGALKMTVINSDGSIPEMCGNGLRCFAIFAQLEKLVSQNSFSVETDSGCLVPNIKSASNGKYFSVQVDMGEPRYDNKEKTLRVSHGEFNYMAVSMGNPHAVIFVDTLSNVPLETWGPEFETHSDFPDRTNTEFVETISKQELKVKVWERGAGATLACGTGACAVLVAGCLTNKCDRSAKIHLPGGPLDIVWNEENNHVLMTGPVELVFKGTITI